MNLESLESSGRGKCSFLYEREREGGGSQVRRGDPPAPGESRQTGAAVPAIEGSCSCSNMSEKR